MTVELGDFYIVPNPDFSSTIAIPISLLVTTLPIQHLEIWFITLHAC